MNKILAMKMSTKYISVYLNNFNVNISVENLTTQQDLFNHVKIMIHKEPINDDNDILDSLPKTFCYIDERFNNFYKNEKSPFSKEIQRCKIQEYLSVKFNELKDTDFRYGKSDSDGLSSTKNIRVLDFFKYIESDMRDFKIKKILNEE